MLPYRFVVVIILTVIFPRHDESGYTVNTCWFKLNIIDFIIETCQFFIIMIIGSIKKKTIDRMSINQL